MEALRDSPHLGAARWSSAVICGNPRSSAGIRGHPRASAGIRGNPSAVIRGHPRSSVRGNQRASADIRGHPRTSAGIRGHPQSLARLEITFFYLGTKRGPDSADRCTKLYFWGKKIAKSLTHYRVLTLLFYLILWEVDFSNWFFGNSDHRFRFLSKKYLQKL